MQNIFAKLYESLLEGRYEGKALKGVSKKTVDQYKKRVKGAGLSDGSVVRKGDMEMANSVVLRQYNELYDRVMSILKNFNVNKNGKVLITDLQKLQLFWNSNSEIDKVIKASHAPVRHAIYKELMKVNKELPYSENQFGFPVYPFHLIPVFVMKDILNNHGGEFPNITPVEAHSLYNMISGKLNLNAEQQRYLVSTKASLDPSDTEPERRAEDLFKVV